MSDGTEAASHHPLYKTWRSMNGKGLTSAEWEEAGYSPRRRSIAYMFGENLIKQNGSGPYRMRYVEAKVRAYETHPEWKWKTCDKCKGENGDCLTCGGIGKTCGHAHNHGMLLATKRLMRELWIEWNA